MTHKLDLVDSSLQNQKIFFIAKDAAKNKELTKQFIYDHGNHLDIKPYNIPYYSDRIYLDFYKQNKGDLDFATREENFIGRAKLNSTQNLIYTRGEETVLPNLDIGCIHLFFNRIAPDYYSLYANHSTYFSHAEIVLPEDQANLLTEEEKIIGKTYFTPPNIPQEQNNQMPLENTIFTMILDFQKK